MEEPNTVSQTESQFSSNMPYLEKSTQSDNTGTSNNTSTEDSVFTSHSNDTQLESPITPPTPPIPRRSTRSTKGKPPERYGQVYTFGTTIKNAPECPKYRQTMYIPCYNCFRSCVFTCAITAVLCAMYGEWPHVEYMCDEKKEHRDMLFHKGSVWHI